MLLTLHSRPMYTAGAGFDGEITQCNIYSNSCVE